MTDYIVSMRGSTWHTVLIWSDGYAEHSRTFQHSTLQAKREFLESMIAAATEELERCKAVPIVGYQPMFPDLADMTIFDAAMKLGMRRRESAP